MQIQRFIKNNWLMVSGVGLALFAMKKISDTGEAVAKTVSLENDGLSKTTASITANLNKDIAVKKALTVAVQSQANVLYGYLRGFTILSSERNNAIKAIFDTLTTNEMVKALYLAYGERATYDNWDLFGFKKHDLIMSLKSNLSEADFKSICYPKLHKAGLIL